MIAYLLTTTNNWTNKNVRPKHAIKFVWTKTLARYIFNSESFERRRCNDQTKLTRKRLLGLDGACQRTHNTILYTDAKDRVRHGAFTGWGWRRQHHEYDSSCGESTTSGPSVLGLDFRRTTQRQKKNIKKFLQRASDLEKLFGAEKSNEI